MKKRVHLLLTALLGFLLGSQGSAAQPVEETAAGEQLANPLQTPVVDNEMLESHARIDDREASDLARESFEGRVVSVRLEAGAWRIRMDQEGNVFNVLVDANSGKVTKASE